MNAALMISSSNRGHIPPSIFTAVVKLANVVSIIGAPD